MFRAQSHTRDRRGIQAQLSESHDLVVEGSVATSILLFVSEKREHSPLVLLGESIILERCRFFASMAGESSYEKVDTR